MFDKVKQRFSKIFVNEEESNQKLFDRGSVDYQNKSYFAAVNSFEELLKKSPNHQQARDILYDCYSKIGKDCIEERDWGGALVYYKDAEKLVPGNPDIHMNIARCRHEIYKSIKEANQPQPWQKPDKEVLAVEDFVLQGGGIKGLAYLGALEELQKHIDISKIKRLGGASAGGITTVLLGIGYTLSELNNILKAFNFEELLDGDFRKQLLTWVENDSLQKLGARAAKDIKAIGNRNNILQTGTNIINIGNASLRSNAQAIKAESKVFSNNIISPSKASIGATDLLSINYNKDVKDLRSILKFINENGLGLFPGEEFRSWIEELLQKKFGIPYLTFKELEKLKVDLPEANIKEIYLVGTNLNGNVEVFSFKTTPDMIISDALRISISIPFIFKPHPKYIKDENGHRVIVNEKELYIDGGVLHNYPLWLFSNTGYNLNILKSDYEKGSNNVLGLRLVSEKIKLQYDLKQKPDVFDVSNLIQYVLQILKIFYDKQESDHSLRNELANTIYINDKGISTIAFNLNQEQIETLFDSGRQAVKEWIIKRQACEQPKLKKLLHNLIESEDITPLKALLRNNRNQMHFVDESGQTILDLALKEKSNNQKWIVRKLVKIGFFNCQSPKEVLEILDTSAAYVKQKSLQETIIKFQSFHNL